MKPTEVFRRVFQFNGKTTNFVLVVILLGARHGLLFSACCKSLEGDTMPASTTSRLIQNELWKRSRSAQIASQISSSPHAPLANLQTTAPAVPLIPAPLVPSSLPDDCLADDQNGQNSLVQNLQQQIRHLEKSARRSDVDIVSTGCAALDQLLPENGLVRGTIVEWLAESPGSSAATLALIAARNACQEASEQEAPEQRSPGHGVPGRQKFARQQTGPQQTQQTERQQTGSLVVVDPQRLFYPPAAAAWGIDLHRTIVLHPTNLADQNWALQQSLNCPAVAAVWALLDEIDERSFRRFQLAAEQSGCIGLFHRPAHVRRQPGWSEIQFAVRPQRATNAHSIQRHLQIELVRCRGGISGKRIDLEINEATGALRVARAVSKGAVAHQMYAAIKGYETHTRHLASQLADSKTGRRSARA
jgi:hypothetical protein